MSEKFDIDKNSRVPIHEQLYCYIKQCITDKTYPVGAVIPSESEMQAQFGVSRITVRRAVSDLERDGFVKKRRGAGTVVIPQKLERDLSSFNSFGGSARVKGQRPGSIILRFEELQVPSVKVAEKLQIGTDENVYLLKRLRMINGRISGLNETYINCRLGVNLSRDDFDSDTSLYELLESRGIHLGSADETIEAKMSDAKLRRELFLDKDQPMVYKERVTYDTDNIPVEFSENTYIAEIYKYCVHIVNVRE